nr:hypothetical protein [Tanacetum cinerariifolium]
MEADPTQWEIAKVEDKVAAMDNYLDAKKAAAGLGKGVFAEKKANYALENCERVFRYTEINDDASKETLAAKEQSLSNPGA